MHTREAAVVVIIGSPHSLILRPPVSQTQAVATRHRVALTELTHETLISADVAFRDTGVYSGNVA